MQVTLTAFATESTHFKLTSLVKHVESPKHKKRRDKCVAKLSGSSGSIVKAFNRQDVYIGGCDKIVIVVFNDVLFDIIEYIAKPKQNTYGECTHTFTFMHLHLCILADAFIQSDLHCVQVTVSTFYQLLLSLGIEPMILALLTPCSTS